MKYLLDTCIVSAMAKRSPHLAERLLKTRPLELAIASITHLEIEYGLMINADAERKVGKALREFCNSVEILAFDRDCADQAAAVRAALKRQGRPIGAFDLLICATALRNKYVMVTANTREFERIDGLIVEDWTVAG